MENQLKVLTAPDLPTLKDQLNRHTEDGWKPAGNPQIFHVKAKSEAEAQAIVAEHIKSQLTTPV